MAEAVDVPVSVKCRVRRPLRSVTSLTHPHPPRSLTRESHPACQMGVDDAAEYEDLLRFVEGVTAASGVRRVTVHARAALLQGISPAANRRVPPLRHDAVHRLKADFPTLNVTLNGGIDTLQQAAAHLAKGLDGVMLGRAVQKNPLLLADVDCVLFGQAPRGDADVADALRGYQRYVDAQVAAAEAAVVAGTVPPAVPRQLRQRAEKPLALPAVAREARRLGVMPPLPPRRRDAAFAAAAAAEEEEEEDADAQEDAPCEEAEG
jgi:tRNA-dihydrouridine synthase